MHGVGKEVYLIWERKHLRFPNGDETKDDASSSYSIMDE
jgi:hypothetical protein